MASSAQWKQTPKAEDGNQTGKSTSGKEGQPCSAFFSSKNNANQVRSVLSPTSAKDDCLSRPKRQPKSDKIKDANMIAQGKAGRNSLHDPQWEEVHAEGYLTAGPKKQSVWWAYDLKSLTSKKRIPVVTFHSNVNVTNELEPHPV